MNILWIPHNSWGEGRYQRDQYFIRYLSPKHEIHVIQWGDYLPHTIFNLLNPYTYIRNLRFYTQRKMHYYIHHIPRFPNISLDNKDLIGTYRINQLFMDSCIKKIARTYNIDIIITGYIGENNPIPSKKLNIPIVVDYVDWPNWSKRREAKVLKDAKAVIAVSHLLYERAKNLNPCTSLIPNGVEIAKFSELNGERIKKKFGLEKNKIVSLIGLTYSRLYFLEAILLAKQKIPELKCILVGKSDSLKKYLHENANFNDTFIYVGPVPYDDIADYFAATDVGLYPVDETMYYDAASPIKIFEYTAAHKPVVLPRIKEMMRINFPNLIFAAPTKESFSAAIIRALKNPVKFPEDMANYDWQKLSSKLEALLLQQVEKHRH